MFVRCLWGVCEVTLGVCEVACGVCEVFVRCDEMRLLLEQSSVRQNIL